MGSWEGQPWTDVVSAAPILAYVLDSLPAKDRAGRLRIAAEHELALELAYWLAPNGDPDETLLAEEHVATLQAYEMHDDHPPVT